MMNEIIIFIIYLGQTMLASSMFIFPPVFIMMYLSHLKDCEEYPDLYEKWFW